MTRGNWVWNDALDAELTRLYVDQGLERRYIAKRMDLPWRTIARRITGLKLNDLLGPVEVAARRRARLEMAQSARLKKKAQGGFHWSDARVGLLERRYLREHVPVGLIAAELGTDRFVVKNKVSAMGLAKQRRAAGLRMVRHYPAGQAAVAVTFLKPGESNPVAFRLTKDPKAALAKAARSRELKMTMAQLEAREVRKLEASAKLMLTDQRVAA